MGGAKENPDLKECRDQVEDIEDSCGGCVASLQGRDGEGEKKVAGDGDAQQNPVPGQDTIAASHTDFTTDCLIQGSQNLQGYQCPLQDMAARTYKVSGDI